MPSLNETVTKSNDLPAWTGSSDDFRRLLRLMEKQFESLIPEHIEEETRHLRRRLAYPQERLQLVSAKTETVVDDFEKAHFEAERVRYEAEIEEIKAKIKDAEVTAAAGGRIDLSLTSKGNERRKVTGTADEIAEYIEGRDIQDLVVSGPSGSISGHSIEVRASRRAGLDVRVSSTDSKWCLAGYAEIEGEIRRQVPGWHFLRSRYVLMALFTTAAFFLIYLALDALAKLTTDTGKYSESTQSWLLVALAIWSLMIAVWSTEWTRRYIPAFEIVPASGRPRGKAIITIVGSTLGALALGVAGNGIYNAVFGTGGS